MGYATCLMLALVLAAPEAPTPSEPGSSAPSADSSASSRERKRSSPKEKGKDSKRSARRVKPTEPSSHPASPSAPQTAPSPAADTSKTGSMPERLAEKLGIRNLALGDTMNGLQGAMRNVLRPNAIIESASIQPSKYAPNEKTLVIGFKSQPWAQAVLHDLYRIQEGKDGVKVVNLFRPMPEYEQWLLSVYRALKNRPNWRSEWSRSQ